MSFVAYATYRRVGERCFGPNTGESTDGVVSYDLSTAVRMIPAALIDRSRNVSLWHFVHVNLHVVVVAKTREINRRTALPIR